MNKRFTHEWVKEQRELWRAEPLAGGSIEAYRINYDPCTPSGYLAPGAAIAIERLCCEVERLQGILEQLENVVTTPAESKADFIARVKEVLAGTL